MGSESLDREDIDLYLWRDNLDPADYVEATYYLETSVEPELAAVAMAKEQSTSTSWHSIPTVSEDRLMTFPTRGSSIFADWNCTGNSS